MALSKHRQTYRVRQIPAYIDLSRLPRILHRVLEYHGAITGIKIFSLATSLSFTENVPTREATVMFDEVPLALTSEKDEWVFSREVTDLPHNLIIDTHFQGFTAFNDIHSADHEFDCVAISGLASHPFGSWRQRDDVSTFMWLRDHIPKALKGTRSIIYGYETRLQNSRSFQTLQDLADSFVSKMQSAEFSSPSSRPLIFIAHSLGGIILKHAVVSMANSGPCQAHMLSKVRKALLFGVPNRGMAINHLLPMVDDQPNKEMIDLLVEGSPHLSLLDWQFSGICYMHQVRLISAVETEMTKVPKLDELGHLKCEGQPEVLVTRDSAIQSGSEAVIPINKDHSNLVKFAEADPDLLAVVRYLQNKVDSEFASQPLQGGSLSKEDANEWFKDPVQTTLEPHSQAQLEDDAVKLLEELIPKTISDMQETLRTDITDRRFREIDAAHDHTLSWIYEESELRLSDWLDHGQGLYWITGKPGSGKSTAMKYICDHLPATLTSTSNKTDVLVKFFFHHRGSHLQKSFEGLLRSILRQLCVASESMAILVLPYYLKNRNGQRLWAIDQLQGAFNDILDHRTPGFAKSLSEAMFNLWTEHVKHKELRRPDVLTKAIGQFVEREADLPRLTLFLDALDEYDGPPHRIISFVLSAVKQRPAPSVQVRICFSSRPWNAFRDAFSDHPGFSMHNHTALDLSGYVTDLMQSSRRIGGMMKSTNQQTRSLAHELKDRLLQRANGVFLWVKLVLQDLLEAATDGATAQELSDVLASLPDELTDLYRTLLERIDSKHRGETYFMLEVLLRAPRTLTLETFWLAVRCAPLDMVEPCVNALGDARSELQEDSEAISRRIRSRGGGLIEIIQETNTSAPSVQLMHQTVTDFLSQPGFQRLLTAPEPAFTTANGYSVFFRYCLSCLREIELRMPTRGFVQEEIKLSDCIEAAYRAELTTGSAERVFLDSVPDSTFAVCFEYMQDITEEQKRDLYPIPRRWPVNSRLSFAVVADLRLYMKDLLRDSQISKRLGGRLLHCAVDATVYPLMTSNFNSRHSDHTQMVRLLLEHGASTTSLRNDMTPFQALYRCLRPHYRDLDDMPRLLEQIASTAAVFVDYGADPLTNVYRTDDPKFPARWTSKAIHVIFSKALLERFLNAGADANCLDSRGMTPLDCIITATDSAYHNVRLECAKLLLDRGGGIKEAIEGTWSFCIFRNAFCNWLERSGTDFDGTFREPPIPTFRNSTMTTGKASETVKSLGLSVEQAKEILETTEPLVESQSGVLPSDEGSDGTREESSKDLVTSPEAPSSQAQGLEATLKRKSSSTYSFSLQRDARLGKRYLDGEEGCAAVEMGSSGRYCGERAVLTVGPTQIGPAGQTSETTPATRFTSN